MHKMPSLDFSVLQLNEDKKIIENNVIKKKKNLHVVIREAETQKKALGGETRKSGLSPILVFVLWPWVPFINFLAFGQL